MLYKKTPLTWALELSWQLFFYSIPAIFDLPAFIDYTTINYFNGDYKKFTIWSIIFVLNIGWIVPNIFYGFLYIAKIPYFEQYRCQDWVWDQEPSKRRTQYMEVLKSTIVTFVINQISLSGLLYMMAIWAMRHTDDQEHIRQWLINHPSALEGFGKILMGLLAFETTFYWSHVWLHTKTGYPYHKDHHAYYTPMSLTGQWGSTIDGLVSLPLPAFVPVFFLNMHPTTLWLYAIIHTAHSSYDHSGYDFPFNPFQFIPFGSHAQAHNFHHSHSIDNFGLYWRFWDQIMGTDKHWKRYCEKRDALIEKIKKGENAQDDDYIIKDGVMLLRCVAEENDIAAGVDNLEYTFQFTNRKVDDDGNLVDGIAAMLNNGSVGRKQAAEVTTDTHTNKKKD